MWLPQPGLIAAVVWVCFASAPVAGDDRPSPKNAMDFGRDVRPILQRHCGKCHGAEKQEGGLRLDVRGAALDGGDSGPVIIPGKSGESAVIRRTSSKDASERMPPEGEPLTPQQIETLRAWIDQGAKWPADEAAAAAHDKRIDHWAFRPVRRPKLPDVKDRAWCRTPIDRFILAKLESQGLRPRPRPTAARSSAGCTFDLIGLPPTPEEVDAFVARRRPATPTRSWSIGCSPRRTTASAGRGTGSTSSTTARRTATTRTSRGPTPGRTATTSSAPSTTTSRTAASCRSRSPATCSSPARPTASRRWASSPPGRGTSSATSELPETKIDGKIARHLDRDDMVGEHDRHVRAA